MGERPETFPSQPKPTPTHRRVSRQATGTSGPTGSTPDFDAGFVLMIVAALTVAAAAFAIGRVEPAEPGPVDTDAPVGAATQADPAAAVAVRA